MSPEIKYIYPQEAIDKIDFFNSQLQQRQKQILESFQAKFIGTIDPSIDDQINLMRQLRHDAFITACISSISLLYSMYMPKIIITNYENADLSKAVDL